MLQHISLHEVIDVVTYWVFGWNVIYVLLPPRELFKSEGYNKFVALVGYYGGMNIRKITTQLYSVIQNGQVTPEVPKEDK